MNKNIFGLLKEVLSDKRLTAFDKNVFCCLITYNGKGKIFPSREEIMNRLNSKNLPTISKSVNQLQNTGYIKIIRRKQKSNIYKLNNDIAEMKPQQKIESIPCPNYEIIKTISGNEISVLELDRISEEKVNALLKEESEKYLIESGIDKGFLSTLLKVQKSISNYKKFLLLMFCIGKLNEQSSKRKIENLKGYLRATFSGNSYSEFHNEVFNAKRLIQQQIRPDKNIIINPEINY